ncbi:hypothetical protein ACMSZU_002938, partial [Cronobacter dublinensis]
RTHLFYARKPWRVFSQPARFWDNKNMSGGDMTNGTMPPALPVSLQPGCENRAAGALRLPALRLPD